MTLQIRIDQAGKAPGTPGQAREDLATGTAVQLTAVGGPFSKYLWTVLWKPIDIVALTRSAATLSSATSNATLLQPIDKAGTFFVEVSVDSGSGLGALLTDVARVTFYAGPTLATDPRQLPRRIPAFQETNEHTVPDALDPTGNPDGWAREWLRWFAVIEQLATKSRELLFYSTVVGQNGGAGNDGPAALAIYNATSDFPGATSVAFAGNFWTDRSNSPPDWAQNTVYSAGNWVQNNGPGGAKIAYVCTTGGLSSVTGAGPSTLGTGISDGAGGTTVWRSALVTIVLVDFTNPSVPVSLGSFSTSYTIAAGIAGGISPLEFSVDVTTAVLALSGLRVLIVAFELDVADTGMTRYTSARSSLAKLVFK